MTADEPDTSLSETYDAECPLCGTRFEANVWRIVDADRRPDLVVHACDGSLQRSHCPRCIGPGVERPAAFTVVRRAGGRLSSYSFFRPETSEFDAEGDSLQAQLRHHAAELGIAADAIDPLGGRWVLQPSDIGDAIDDTWPDLKTSVDPKVLAGPLPALLAAAAPEDYRAALLACPDLARPNVERFLGHLVEQGNERQRIAALLARYFVAAARACGLDEAVRIDQVEQARLERRKTLPEPLQQRLYDFVDRQPSADDDLDPLAAEALSIGQALDAAGVPGPKADVWARCGDLIRRHPGPPRPDTMRLAVGAYALALKSLEPDRAHQAWVITMGMSAAWHLRGDGDRSAHIEQALACASAAREQAQILPGDDQAEAAMEQGIVYTHRIMGDPAANLAFAREALEFAVRQALDAPLRAMAKYNLALVDVEDPENGAALDSGLAMLQALATPAALQAWFDESQQQNLFHSLGAGLAKRATRATGPIDGDPQDLDRAAEAMERALAIAQRRGALRDQAVISGLLARIEADRRLRGRGERDLAQIMALIDAAGALLTPESEPYEYARNELRRAGVLRDLGEPDLVGGLAIAALNRACSVLTPQTAPNPCRRAQAELARWHLQANDPASAAQAYAVACEASEQVYRAAESVAGHDLETAPNASLHAGLVDALARVLESLADTASDTGSGNDVDTAWRVLEAMEAGRARLTLDLLGLRPLPPFDGVPDALREREAQLIAELGWSTSDRSAQRGDDDAERYRQQRERRDALERLWQEIEGCGPGGRRHTALRRTRPPRRDALAAYAASLGERAAIASFYLLQDRVIVAWLRAGSAPRVYPVALPAQVLCETWIAAFDRDVRRDTGTPSPGHDWLALGEMLFAPVAADIAALDLLVLVPHGALHALPLHALQVRGRPLIEQVPVLYGTSIGVLAAIGDAERANTRTGPALVASHATNSAEAPSFEGEANAVAARLATRALHHATRRAVLQAAPAAGHIHLVCHGTFDPEDPLASGVLHARDWLTLPLVCDLVALSACDTGRQEVGAGDELTGLAQTLLRSGASSVLLALWRIGSAAAAQWMASFYAAAGRSRAVAFQQATIALRRIDPDPRAWAAFVLIGDAGDGGAQPQAQDSTR